MYDLSPTTEIKVYKTMIYIYVDKEREGPTIAFKFKSKNGYVFIDASCRVYKSWDDFKENNKLPECQVAYPKNGEFNIDKNGTILVDYQDSPACSTLKAVTKGADITASVIGVGTTIVGIVGLFTPLTAPIAIASLVAGGATGVYGAGRSVAQLVDRSEHEESISLADAEARLHWLNIATAPLAIAGGVATMTTQRVAASGQLLSRTAEVLVNTAIFSSFSMSSVNIINNLANLIDKANKDELSALDVTSFVISVAFWTNSAVNLRTANGIIKMTQHEVLHGYKDGLSGQEKKMFKVMRKNMNNPSETHDSQYPKYMHENAKAIRYMKNVQNPKEFFSNAIVANKQLQQTNKDSLHGNKLKISLADYNCMSINDQLKIAPQKFNQLTDNEKETILQATINYINDKNETAFLQSVKSVNGIKFEVHRKNGFRDFENIVRNYDSNVSDLKEFKCNGKKFFKDLKPHEENRVMQIKESLSQHSAERQKIALKFADEMKPENLSDYASYIEYALCTFIEDTKVAQANGVPKNQAKLSVTQNYYDEFNRIKPTKMNDLKNRYNEDFKEAKSLNDSMTKPFARDAAATYHCKKHGTIENITPEEYIAKIEQIIANTTSEKTVTLTQEGDAHVVSYMMTYEDNSRKKVLVIVRPNTKEYTMTMMDA